MRAIVALIALAPAACNRAQPADTEPDPPAPTPTATAGPARPPDPTPAPGPARLTPPPGARVLDIAAIRKRNRDHLVNRRVATVVYADIRWWVPARVEEVDDAGGKPKTWVTAMVCFEGPKSERYRTRFELPADDAARVTPGQEYGFTVDFMGFSDDIAEAPGVIPRFPVFNAVALVRTDKDVKAPRIDTPATPDPKPAAPKPAAPKPVDPKPAAPAPKPAVAPDPGPVAPAPAPEPEDLTPKLYWQMVTDHRKDLDAGKKAHEGRLIRIKVVATEVRTTFGTGTEKTYARFDRAATRDDKRVFALSGVVGKGDARLLEKGGTYIIEGRVAALDNPRDTSKAPGVILTDVRVVH